MSKEDNETLKYFKKVYDELIEDEKYQKYTSLMGFYHKKIEQLQQENEELKQALENKRVCYYNNKAYDIKTLLNKNNILTEFEKWIEYQIRQCEKETNPKQFSEHDIEITTNTMCRFQQCLDKLQKLKEGNK